MSGPGVLLPLFERLREEPPPREARFRALPVPGVASYELGIDAEGLPALLVSPSGGSGRRQWEELEHLFVLRGARCLVRGEGAREEERVLTVIGCKTGGLAPHFLRATETLISMAGEGPSALRLDDALSGLVDLFSALSGLPQREVQGLWAELFLLAHARSPREAASAWHATPSDLFDFNGGAQRVEVKSTSGPERAHHFSLRQLRPPTGTTLVVASIIVEEAGAGVSLRDLLERALREVSGDPPLALRIEQQVASTLGCSYERAIESRFDVEKAHESLRFIDHVHIPSVPCELPSEVTEVRMKVHVEACPQISPSESNALGGLVAALQPR